MNPSTFPPVGLFWTIELPEDAVEVEFSKGRASLRGFDVSVFDYGDLPTALFGPVPSPLPVGSVSFRVLWSGAGQRVNIRNTDPVYGGFGGEFIRNKAQMEWTATIGEHVRLGPVGDIVELVRRDRPRAERLLLSARIAP